VIQTKQSDPDRMYCTPAKTDCDPTRAKSDPEKITCASDRVNCDPNKSTCDPEKVTCEPAFLKPGTDKTLYDRGKKNLVRVYF